MAERIKGTSTSRFGAGRREAHDATDFYARFSAPVISDDDAVHGPVELDEPLRVGDSRDLRFLPDNSVALVVTSPPYFAGKAYEEEMGRGHIPGSYVEFLRMLEDVFAECARVLEPGGRIAVNVANLGRKPYRSLSADVIAILQDQLGLLLRGEVIWQKARGSSGSCAWGSFGSSANPVLRDVTERVVIASKGRFDRALSAAERSARGLPHRNSLTSDEFMEATTDVWELAPESARRVGHPAPFPVSLPKRLIELYTYEGDLVLDPFLGAGTTAVAAARTGRRYAGCDTDPDYVAIARRRVEEVEASLRAQTPQAKGRRAIAVPAIAESDNFQRLAVERGKAAQAIAIEVLEDAGFEIVARPHKLGALGIEVNVLAHDAAGREWYFDVSGAFSTSRGGLVRTDTLWKSLGKASILVAGHEKKVNLILLTSELPKRRSAGDKAMRALGHKVIFDAIEMLSEDGRQRLAQYASGAKAPLPGFWTDAELGRD